MEDEDVNYDVSLAFLRPSTLELLSLQLNQEKILLSEHGACRLVQLTFSPVNPLHWNYTLPTATPGEDTSQCTLYMDRGATREFLRGGDTNFG